MPPSTDGQQHVEDNGKCTCSSALAHQKNRGSRETDSWMKKYISGTTVFYSWN